MKPKDILAKIKAYPLALSLIGVAILLAGITYWRSTSTLEDARSEVDTVTQESDRLSKNTAASELLDEQLAEVNADATKFATGLINPVEDISNQQYFYDLEHAAGVEQVTDPAHTTTDRSKDTAEPSVAAFSLSVSGHWDNILSFLYALQSGPHPLRISIFQLVKSPQTRNTSDTDRLVLTLTVEMLGK